MASKFPAPVYAETVLSHNFRDAQRFFFEALLEVNYAHTLMLARQGIIPAEAARACLLALENVDRKEILSAVYDGEFEDLFFFVESRLEALAGPDAAGRMHTARSRNDLCIALYRMRARVEALEILSDVSALTDVLLGLVRQHAKALMPAYTHTQPAQPTTLGHYLMAYTEVLGRDAVRLQAAFATINRSPLGACAITTTGFPIDRQYTAGMLGFEGLQLNSFGAIAATDYLTEFAAAVAGTMASLGKFVQDLLLWCNPALGFLRLNDAWVQISSIMPQKRNPVPLEHTRILASRALSEAQAVFTCVHNTPFGDINDSEDDIQPLVFTMAGSAQRALRLLCGVLADAEFQTSRMAEHAAADFLTVTELADTLVRAEGLSFRDAHHLVSAAVKQLNSVYSPSAMAAATRDLAPGAIGRDLQLSQADLEAALDAREFVEKRDIPGGPGALESAREQAETAHRGVQAWIEAKRDLLARYPEKIREAKQIPPG
ncbi:MAG TPA: argininosuccinate lyase [Bryobacteraceae bacterium]|nr:argininosuccinate lyase [Bryobacteraceae bacterium]